MFFILRRLRDSNPRYGFPYTHFLPMHRDSFNHSVRIYFSSLVLIVLYIFCFSFSLFLSLFSRLHSGNYKLQNILTLKVFLMKCICSFHRYVLTYGNPNRRIGRHKMKNPSGFEGYKHKIFQIPFAETKGFEPLIPF